MTTIAAQYDTKYFKRLIPASQATAVVAALVHVITLGFIAGDIGIESIYIAFLTYIIALIITIPVGGVLLTIIRFLRLGLVLSLILFISTSVLVVIATTMYFFEAKYVNIPWKYTVISTPASLTTWYFSVYKFWEEG